MRLWHHGLGRGGTTLDTLKSGMASRWRVNDGLAGHWIKQWLGVAAIKGALQASTRWLLLISVLGLYNSWEGGLRDCLTSNRKSTRNDGLTSGLNVFYACWSVFLPSLVVSKNEIIIKGIRVF
jgi:hypothetical protein